MKTDSIIIFFCSHCSWDLNIWSTSPFCMFLQESTGKYSTWWSMNLNLICFACCAESDIRSYVFADRESSLMWRQYILEINSKRKHDQSILFFFLMKVFGYLSAEPMSPFFCMVGSIIPNMFWELNIRHSTWDIYMRTYMCVYVLIALYIHTCM